MPTNTTAVPLTSVLKILASRGYGENHGSYGHLSMNMPSGQHYSDGSPKLQLCPAEIKSEVVGVILNGSANADHAADRIEAMLLGRGEAEESILPEPPPQPVAIDFDAIALLVEKRAVDKLLSVLADSQKQAKTEIARLKQDLAELAVSCEKRLKKLEERVGRGPGRPPKAPKSLVKDEPKVDTDAEKRRDELAAKILELPDESDPYHDDKREGDLIE